MQQTYSILIRFNINTDVTILLSGQNGTSSEEWKGIFFCVLFRICVSFCFLSSAVRFSFVLVVWPLVFIYILLLQCSIQLFTLPFNWHTPLLLFFCFFFLFCFKSLVTFSLSNILTATDNSISNKNGEKKKRRSTWSYCTAANWSIYFHWISNFKRFIGPIIQSMFHILFSFIVCCSAFSSSILMRRCWRALCSLRG